VHIVANRLDQVHAAVKDCRAMTRLTISLLLVAAFAAVGCGDDDKSSDSGATSTPDTGAATLDVGMDEFSFSPSSLEAEAGKVTVTAKNDGKAEHELVVLKTDADPAKLPMKGGEVDESTSVGEIPDVAPGKSASATLDLKPGKYAVICNLPGHYKGGMYGSLTVR